jgi:hypothetical protein
MKPFEFHAELFDFRNAVMEALSDNGFVADDSAEGSTRTRTSESSAGR